MAARRLEEIPMKDLVISRGQARTTNVSADIDELAQSIRTKGLLEPIVVCPAETEGKYEILAGQRRFLACQQLKRKTIEAVIRPERADDTEAKVLSLTENVMRRDLTSKEKIDACTSLYRKYGSIEDVCQETGLPYREVREYVKFDRLSPKLKKLVDEGLDLKTALRASDAARVGGDYNEAEAVKLAKEMATMATPQMKRVLQQRRENPTASIDEIIEDAKSGERLVEITVALGPEIHSSLKKFAKAEGTDQAGAAEELISEGLKGKGFLDE